MPAHTASALSNHFHFVVSTSNTPLSTDCLRIANHANHTEASYNFFALISGFLQSHPIFFFRRWFCNTLPHMNNPPERAPMAALHSLLMEDLYTVLGYYKEHPTRSKDALHDEITDFYNNYIAVGNSPLPPTRARSEAAVQCARKFLLEGNRGERLWPMTSGGAVEWHTDRE